MPNTFANRLVVEGASSEVNRFVKRARGRHAVYLPTDRTPEVKSGKQMATNPTTKSCCLSMRFTPS